MLQHRHLVFLMKTTGAETLLTAGKLGVLGATTREDSSEAQQGLERCWRSAGFPSAAKESRHGPRQTDAVCHLLVARLKMGEESEQGCQEMLE